MRTAVLIPIWPLIVRTGMAKRGNEEKKELPGPGIYFLSTGSQY